MYHLPSVIPLPPLVVAAPLGTVAVDNSLVPVIAPIIVFITGLLILERFTTSARCFVVVVTKEDNKRAFFFLLLRLLLVPMLLSNNSSCC